MGMIENGVYPPKVIALSIGKTRENDDIFPMIYRKTFVLPILFHHPQDESAQQLMNVLMDTLMGSNGQKWWVFSRFFLIVDEFPGGHLFRKWRVPSGQVGFSSFDMVRFHG